MEFFRGFGQISRRKIMNLFSGRSENISKNYFTLAPRAEEKIEFITYVPASAQVDANYTGRMYLFKIPTFGL